MKSKNQKLKGKQEEQGETPELQTEIKVGDVSVTSFKNLKTCEKTIVKILKNPTIKTYLQGYQVRKMLGKLPYIE